VSQPGGDELDIIRDRESTSPDVAGPQTAKEQGNYARTEDPNQPPLKLTPAVRLELSHENRIAELKIVIARHLDECKDLKAELAASRKQLLIKSNEAAELKIKLGELRADLRSLQANGQIAAGLIVIGGLLASAGSYYIPDIMGYVCLLVAVVLIAVGLIVQGFNIRLSYRTSSDQADGS